MYVYVYTRTKHRSRNVRCRVCRLRFSLLFYPISSLVTHCRSAAVVAPSVCIPPLSGRPPAYFLPRDALPVCRRRRSVCVYTATVRPAAGVPRQVCNAHGHWASSTSVLQDTRQGSRPTTSSTSSTSRFVVFSFFILLYPLI
jgi:hypothetical protein